MRDGPRAPAHWPVRQWPARIVRIVVTDSPKCRPSSRNRPALPAEPGHPGLGRCIIFVPAVPRVVPPPRRWPLPRSLARHVAVGPAGQKGAKSCCTRPPARPRSPRPACRSRRHSGLGWPGRRSGCAWRHPPHLHPQSSPRTSTRIVWCAGLGGNEAAMTRPGRGVNPGGGPSPPCRRGRSRRARKNGRPGAQPPRPPARPLRTAQAISQPLRRSGRNLGRDPAAVQPRGGTFAASHFSGHRRPAQARPAVAIAKQSHSVCRATSLRSSPT